jgi:hypothetical protein
METVNISALTAISHGLEECAASGDWSTVFSICAAHADVEVHCHAMYHIVHFGSTTTGYKLLSEYPHPELANAILWGVRAFGRREFLGLLACC